MTLKAGGVGVLGPFLALVLGLAVPLRPQTAASERVFPQAKAAVENALKALQSNLSGRLPTLDGFATAAEHPLEQYQRAYYQSSVQVAATPSGGSWVRVSAKVTAWYSDPATSHSGYQLLKSNGRLEADLLDQLAEQLSRASETGADRPDPTPAPAPAAEPATTTPPAIPAPAPAAEFPQTGAFSSSRRQGIAIAERTAREKSTLDKSKSALQAEADGLEQILNSQAHPKNLVAVTKSGTPVVASPSLNAKPLFLASRHDEFELLDFNQDWVHVRVSGLSRGWIWRSSLEMPEGIPDTASHPPASSIPSADLFHVTREESAPFPGDWPPLRGKNVRIISVQKVDENQKGGGAQDKLEYAKYLLDKNAATFAQAQDLAGIVLIFDSADGGMIAATAATLQQWKSGALSDATLWHNCFFDPPEIFNSNPPSASSGTQ